jgi:hypothetical protein
MGRAFTISMNLNFAGFPIGAALAGVMLTIWPVEVAIAFAVAANVAGAILAYVLIPQGDGASPGVDSAAPAGAEAPAPTDAAPAATV